MMHILEDVSEWGIDGETQLMVLVRGVPGSGKSTMARMARDHMLSYGVYCVHLESDQFVTRRGEYLWTPETVRHSHEWCAKTAEILLDTGANVIVSNTFTKVSEMTKYIGIAERADVPVLIVEIPVRRFKDIHNVPDTVISQMTANLALHNQYAVKAHVDKEFPAVYVGYVKATPEIEQCN